MEEGEGGKTSPTFLYKGKRQSVLGMQDPPRTDKTEYEKRLWDDVESADV